MISQVINMKRLSFSTFEVETAAILKDLEDYSMQLQKSFDSSSIFSPSPGDLVIVRSDMYYRAKVRSVVNTECLVKLLDVIGERIIQFHNIRRIPEVLALQPILKFRATFNLLQIFDFLEDNQIFNTLLDYSIRKPGLAITVLAITDGLANCTLLHNGQDMILSILCEFFYRFNYIHRPGELLNCVYSSMSGSFSTIFVQHNLEGLQILESMTQSLLGKLSSLKTLTHFKPGDFGIVVYKGKPHRAIVQNSQCCIHRLMDVGILVQTPRLFGVPEELKMFPPQAVEIPVFPEDQCKIIEMECGTKLQLLNTFHWFKLVRVYRFPGKR